MLHRVGEGEEIAHCVFESVAKCYQFLPAIDGDKPPVLQIPSKFFRLDAKIDNVRVGPDKWVERLDVGSGRSICFAAVHAHSPAFAQLNGHDARRRIGAKEQRVFLEFHIERFLDFARNDKL